MVNIARNSAAIDVKPKDIAVIDVKSKNSSIIDTKSKDISVFGETKVYLTSKTILQGQPIPLGGFILTYPTSLTFNITRL